ncbi:diphthine-ammonia ligase [Nematocida minor]|uniref:diphthine-ammonia ligase n=1 Tax=Nematocida minor TaxID=1912983 RepID=UPI002220E7EA|nr:diphthine-ammonia ligase [Nematocida minor]KAI5192638.1 diphthine-ammonia ligase [Nematocida minor]
MQFLALVSGGKDSIFNMQIAAEEGHTAVCLLNMKMCEEKDSFMFQYAGCDVLPGIAESLGLPLHQFSTNGFSKIRSIDYTAEKDDEIEDLHSAIKSLLDMYSFTGVSVGAISSVYQYNRVKNVCSRLNLEMLGYLWGMDQRKLIDRMISTGINAIIVKGGGFLSTLVGCNLSEVRAKYSEYIDSQIEEHKGLTEKDFNMCGEGGEYETITLDSPIYTKKIEIVSSTIEDDGAGVKTLKILQYKLLDKSEE